jgi:predicted ATP-grasp superfamily ATP-dependent carboligase
MALAGLSMHHGALGAVRSAGRLGIPVFHAHGARRCPLDSSRFSEGNLRLPTDLRTAEQLELLRGFSRRYGRSVLLPVDDASAVFVSDHAAALSEYFAFPHQPPGLARTLANKRELDGVCRAHGVHSPVSYFPSDREGLLAQAGQAGFPIVVKRIDKTALRPGDGRDAAAAAERNGRPAPAPAPAPSVRLVRSERELLAIYDRMDSSERANVMLQEHIPADTEGDWMFNGYFDGSSRCVLGSTGIKLRQSPASAGATTLGICMPNSDVDSIARRLLGALGYRGIVDVDLRRDPRDGRYKLLDVNPRIGSSFRLFVCETGVDVLQAMYLDLTGERVPDGHPCEQRRWLAEIQDLRAVVSELRDGALTPSAWMASLRGIDETAWWSWDDPQPLFAASGRLLAGRLGKQLRDAARSPRRRARPR